MTAKPTVSELGLDLSAQVWHRSGHGDGVIEVAFTRAATHTAPAQSSAQSSAQGPAESSAQSPADAVEWVLMRVAGDPGQRVLVFDRHEWECFLDGARNGEFDAAAAPTTPPAAAAPTTPPAATGDASAP